MSDDASPPEDAGRPEVLLVGVGHVFDIHDQLRAVIHSVAPGAVLVELDQRRFAALKNPEEAEHAGGLYGVLSRFQQKAADSLGTTPGAEMLTAVEAAHEVGAAAGLIDLDAQVAFRRMWKEMSIREKLKFLWAALRAMFASEEEISEEVEELRGDYTDLMEAFAVQFPSAKRVLIDERNEVMADRIRNATDDFDRIVAVLGDGHIEGMADLLADLDPGVIRLEDLMEGAFGGFDVEVSDDLSQAGFSFEPE